MAQQSKDFRVVPRELLQRAYDLIGNMTSTTESFSVYIELKKCLAIEKPILRAEKEKP